MEEIVKQIIVVRKDLIGEKEGQMGYGKLSAQVAHASISPILEKMRGIPYEMLETSELKLNDYRLFIDLKKGDALKEWIEGSFRKIILYVKNEDQLLKLDKKIKEAGFISTVIKDSGFTVFKEPTITCLGIEPLFANQIDPLTKRLRLLD